MLRATRRFAVLPVAALAVHQLRFELAFGSGAGRELAATGHHYLSGLLPWVAVSAMLAAAASLSYALQSGGAAAAGPRRSPLASWLLIAAGLLAVFVAQELLEGVFATGHPPGLAGVVGDGGLWAIPAALAVAGLLVLTRRGEAALARVLARPETSEPPRRPPPAAPRPARTRRPAPTPLASSAAGRAPPARVALAR